MTTQKLKIPSIDWVTNQSLDRVILQSGRHSSGGSLNFSKCGSDLSLAKLERHSRLLSTIFLRSCHLFDVVGMGSLKNPPPRERNPDPRAQAIGEQSSLSQQPDDDDDEQDYVLVSSMQQRLDLLHAHDDDDDIIEVRIPAKLPSSPRPSITMKWWRDALNTFTSPSSPKFETWSSPSSSSIALAATILALLLLFLSTSYRQRKIQKKIRSKEESKAKRKLETSSSSQERKNPVQPNSGSDCLITSSPSKKKKVCVEKTTKSENMIVKKENGPKIVSSEEVKAEDKTDLDHRQEKEVPPLTVETEFKALTNTQTEHAFKKLDKISSSPISMEQKIKAIAQEIQLYESMLIENGIPKEQASQLAVNLKTSQQLIESQRELELHRLSFEHEHRAYDRQMSERHHRESLQATKYDPNWSDKLEASRDRCIRSLTRLLLEVVLVHHSSRILKPMIDLYRLKHLLSVMDILSLVGTTICSTCQAQATTISTTPTLLPVLWDDSTLISTLQWMTGMDQIFFESSLCYGHCIISYAALGMITVILHQVVRIFSAGGVVHGAVNAGAALVIYQQSNFILWDSNVFPLLLASLLATFWSLEHQFQTKRTIVKKASVGTFDQVFDKSLESMKRWERGLVAFRMLIVGAYAASLFVDRTV